MAINSVRMVDADGKITREWMPFFRSIEKLVNAQTESANGEQETSGLTLAQVLQALGSMASKSAEEYTPSTAFWGGVDYAQQQIASPLFFEGQQVMPQQTASSVLVWLS